MGINIPTIDYTKREYTSNKEELQQLIKTRFPEVWTDFSDSNLGEALLELIAYDYSLQSFMLDKMANESYLDTVKLRENLLRLVALIAYPVSGATSASLPLNASLFSTETNDVVIKKGTEVRTVDEVVFETDADYLISAGNLTPMSVVLSASPSLTTDFTEASRNIEFSSALPSNVRVGHFLRATTGTDNSFYQIRSISTDRLSAELYSPWPNLDATEQFEVYNKQITIIQGETKNDTFTSDGSNNQEFTTTFGQAAEGSLVVVVDGEEWSSIESLIYSDEGKHYEVDRDAADRLIVRFGDGVLGKKPADGVSIEMTYRTTVGASGNIALNTIDTTVNGYIGATTVSIRLSNPVNRGSGGSDRETIEHIKKFAPKYVRTNDRAVTVEDYETLSATFSDPTYGAIAEASASLNTNKVPRENNLVYVYVWAEGQAGELLIPSDGLRTSLKSFLDTKKMIGTEILVLPGVKKDVDVTAVIEFDRRLDSSEVSSKVEEALAQVFEQETFSPGDSLYISKLYEAVEAILGVENAYIITDPVHNQGRIDAEKYETISAGTIEVKRIPIPPVWLIVPLTGVVGTPYTVKWSAVTGVDGYTLQEATQSNFQDAVDIYTGTNTEFNVTKSAPGTFYYRIKTFNVYGESGWIAATNSIEIT